MRPSITTHINERETVLTTLLERDKSKPAKQQGMFKKFIVRRMDSSDAIGGKHYGCEYFVLDLVHDQHAGAALMAYSLACADTHPLLSQELVSRYGTTAGAQPSRDKIIRLEGEAKVLRELLREATDVIDTLIDDDDDSEGTGLLSALKEKCIAAITGVPA